MWRRRRLGDLLSRGLFFARFVVVHTHAIPPPSHRSGLQYVCSSCFNYVERILTLKPLWDFFVWWRRTYERQREPCVDWSNSRRTCNTLHAGEESYSPRREQQHENTSVISSISIYLIQECLSSSCSQGNITYTAILRHDSDEQVESPPFLPRLRTRSPSATLILYSEGTWSLG